tara:strand:- start:743 stop:898 length:156 start_codon:yes stop_codon:yes gene_type:complete
MNLIADFSNTYKTFPAIDFVKQSCEDTIKILDTFPNSNDLYVDFVLTNNEG